MAAVFITLQDKPDGSVDVRLVAEPMPTSEDDMTPAQQMGASALNAIHANLRTSAGRIILAGADELPH